MTNMIQTQEMHNHTIPITVVKFCRQMPCHVRINLGEILGDEIPVRDAIAPRVVTKFLLTETKKLDVPSARANIVGNSFNQVSSPYMTRRPPPGRDLSCASQLS